jgi:integration host factor subunit alpha
MTKAELAERICEKVGFGRRESAEIVETLLDLMKESLAQGEKIKISGFGNFVLRSKHERVGRNPHTGEQLKITARRVLSFKASHILKQAVNRGHA